MDSEKKETPLAFKRVCVFAHFDALGIIDDYVIYYLQALRSLNSKLIFVSTALLQPNELTKINSIVDIALIKKNVGYDFGSWQYGLSDINLDDFDELLLCNDSCYGPIFNLEPIFQKMNSVACDYWAMTHCRQIYPHLQSYFLVFKKNILNDPHFKSFWLNIQPQNSKIEYIIKYEIGLSKLLTELGYQGCSYLKTQLFLKDQIHILVHSLLRLPKTLLPQVWFLFKRLLYLIGLKRFKRGAIDVAMAPYGPIIEAFKPNYTHLFWILCLSRGIPFVKVELLKANPLKLFVGVSEIQNRVVKRSYFNFDLIRSHLKRMNDLSTSNYENKDYLFENRSNNS